MQMISTGAALGMDIEGIDLAGKACIAGCFRNLNGVEGAGMDRCLYIGHVGTPLRLTIT